MDLFISVIIDMKGQNNGEFKIPDGIVVIAGGTFYNQGITSIEVPDSVTYIGESAFSVCDDLISISLGEGVTYIEESSFASCDRLTSLSFTASLKYLGERFCDGCDSLTEINVSENNKTFTTGANGEIYDKNKQILIAVPAGIINEIEKYSFADITGLTNITIPGTVETIGVQSFEGCESLVSVTIESGVKYIELWAFSQCNSLKSVTIPSSIQSINEDAFKNGESLTDIYFEGSEGQWQTYDVEIPNSVTVHYNV